MATNETATVAAKALPATSVQQTAPKAAAKPASKPVAKAAAKTVKKAAAAKKAAKPAAKTAVAAPKKTTVSAPKAAVAPKPAKEKKIKMVRDSLTMPKLEYVVLEELKLRAAKMSTPIKKTELIRAGIKALAGMNDAAFMSAVRAVPSLKTGRPSKEK